MASEYKLPYKAREVARRLEAVVTLEDLVGEKSVQTQIYEIVDALPSELFIISISENVDEEDSVVYVSDKSFSEVETAIRANRIIVVLFEGYRLQLVEYLQHKKMVFAAVSNTWGGTFLWDATTNVISYAPGGMGSGSSIGDDELIEIFIEQDMLPVVVDSDESMLADENGNILLW